MNTKELILSAIFAAVISIFSVMAIPLGAVSITLGVFGILITAVILSPKLSVVSTAIFILLGIAGLPVFGGMRGGIGVILGPTGGYILSYIPMALIVSAMSEKKGFFRALSACLFALILCYCLGTCQYMLITETPLEESLIVCVYPFVVFDVIKAVAAVILGQKIKKRL